MIAEEHITEKGMAFIELWNCSLSKLYRVVNQLTTLQVDSHERLVTAPDRLGEDRVTRRAHALSHRDLHSFPTRRSSDLVADVSVPGHIDVLSGQQ